MVAGEWRTGVPDRSGVKWYRPIFCSSSTLRQSVAYGPANIGVYRRGAIFHVPVEVDVTLDALPVRFARLACLDLQGESIATPAFRECDCYIFGNEARGLPRGEMGALAARTFAIRGTGTMESLNVATAVTACQYELARNPD
jgi:tRNA G18 (ribose-2'-O)-methylase SpoU